MEEARAKAEKEGYMWIACGTAAFAPCLSPIMAVLFIVCLFIGQKLTTKDKWGASTTIIPGLRMWVAFWIASMFGVENDSYGMTFSVAPFWIGLPFLLWAMAPKNK